MIFELKTPRVLDRMLFHWASTESLISRAEVKLTEINYTPATSTLFILVRTASRPWGNKPTQILFPLTLKENLRKIFLGVSRQWLVWYNNLETLIFFRPRAAVHSFRTWGPVRWCRDHFSKWYLLMSLYRPNHMIGASIDIWNVK